MGREKRDKRIEEEGLTAVGGIEAKTLYPPLFIRFSPKFFQKQIFQNFQTIRHNVIQYSLLPPFLWPQFSTVLHLLIFLGEIYFVIFC
jgi:hypothetical protein